MGPQLAILARSFDADGARFSPLLEMQPKTNALDFSPGIAVDGRGHFTVAWSVLNLAAQYPARLRMRRFLRNGIPTARTVEVARDTGETAAISTFGRGADEGVEIVWRSTGAPDASTIRVQRFDRQLRPLGDARAVANSGFFGTPSIRVDAKGRSAIVWGLNGPQTRSLFLEDTLAPCSPPFPVQRGRAVSAVGLAFSGPEEVAIGLLEEGTDTIRRLVVRTFSLAVCPARP